MLRRTALRLAAAALAASLVAGAACLSPTLPLPPPEEPDTVRPSDEHPGMWEISGDCYAGAIVVLFNDRTRKGVLMEDADQDGRYRITIEAELCDLILISQEIATEENGVERSANNSFVIEERDSTGVLDDQCP